MEGSPDPSLAGGTATGFGGDGVPVPEAGEDDAIQPRGQFTFAPTTAEVRAKRRAKPNPLVRRRWEWKRRQPEREEREPTIYSPHPPYSVVPFCQQNRYRIWS
eukprot:6467983-Prorocentrum_lima.AAC.1